MAKVCTSCEKEGGLPCAIKHAGVAAIYCHEARVQPDSRRRMLRAYDNFSHISDEHLSSTYPQLAQKARSLRKQWESCAFYGRGKCPPDGACEEIENFQQELVHELEKHEHGEEPILAAQEVDTTSKEKEDYTPFLIIGGVVSLVIGSIIAQRLRLSSQVA